MSPTRPVAAAALAAALLLPAAPSIAGPPASPAAPEVLKVGGDVKEPVLVHRVTPAYPEESRTNRIQGNVILSAVVDEKGAVSKVEAVDSPDPGLTKAAVEAVKQWTYKPATKKGKPVKVQMTVTVSFKLS